MQLTTNKPLSPSFVRTISFRAIFYGCASDIFCWCVISRMVSVRTGVFLTAPGEKLLTCLLHDEMGHLSASDYESVCARLSSTLELSRFRETISNDATIARCLQNRTAAAEFEIMERLRIVLHDESPTESGKTRRTRSMAHKPVSLISESTDVGSAFSHPSLMWRRTCAERELSLTCHSPRATP